MTLSEVAKFAGVSTATVSRVINHHPHVAPDTAAAVRRVMQETQFTPRRRRHGGRPRAMTIALLIFGASRSCRNPAFMGLLRGVSSGATEHELDMVLAYISEPHQLPPRVLQRRVDGLLLHGDQPPAALQSRLRELPSVWLMANRQRPTWGDQVMPDNAVVGELAARYLVRLGHRTLALINLRWDSWSLDLRALEFTRTAEELGASVVISNDSRLQPEGKSEAKDLLERADAIIDGLLRLDPRPTGLFVVEDRQVQAIDSALRRRGLSSGPGGVMEFVSCNNEWPLLVGVAPPPATIDIRTELIGRCAVELLLARLQHPSCGDNQRIRNLIEPSLVEASRDLA